MKTYRVCFDEALHVSQGALLDDFQFPWLDSPSPKTEFRAVWNEAHFAFRFEVEDRDIVVSPHEEPALGALDSDRVELFFATSADLIQPYYGAEMDPSGRVYDFRATYYREVNAAWSFETLQFSGDRIPDGYTVSGRIAMSELEALGLIQEGKMRTGVYRAEFSRDSAGSLQRDWVSWVDPQTERPDFHVPSSFGVFEFCP